MAKPSNRDKLLTEGLRVVHDGALPERVFRHRCGGGGTAGSFTNHFASKEAFGLEIINLYFSSTGPCSIHIAERGTDAAGADSCLR